MKLKILTHTLIPVIFFMTGICISQEIKFDEIDKYIEIKKWIKADSIFNVEIKKNHTKNEVAKLNYYKGVILFNNGLHDRGFEYLNKSKKYFEKSNRKKELALTLGQIIECINYAFDGPANQMEYIIPYCKLAQELNDYNFEIDCEYFKGTYAFDKKRYKEGIEHYRNVSNIAIANNDTIRYLYNQVNEGMHLGYYEGQPKKSIELYKEIIPKFVFKDDRQRQFSSMYNLSFQYYLLGDIKSAIKILHNADTIQLNSDILDSKSTLYYRLSAYYQANKNYKSSLQYLDLYIAYNDSVNTIEQQKSIQIIKEELNNQELKTNNQELRADNLETEAKSKRSQTIAFGLGSTLLLGSIIAFLVYRNTKRKQHIAEQDRELQIQKTETILKEKEIETINAMVSGQEKERLRLAGELHDNLGSTLATVRMQVENLERNLDKVEDPKELLKKTNILVNEAYDKVRKISHERNSGVMAKDGLLPAVQKLARTVSNANSLTVDVQDFGLENRIANELEITIFRIIQELVTNIIKHAQATEANISLTQHDNELNIMVEDNGKGFKVGKLKEKEGMGLGNIERRIEHLEGSMEVDSNPGRGTSISIDIPL